MSGRPVPSSKIRFGGGGKRVNTRAHPTILGIGIGLTEHEIDMLHAVGFWIDFDQHQIFSRLCLDR